MEELVVIVVCLILNALFSAYEMAFVSVPRQELRRLAKSGLASAQRLVALREHPERTLSIIQVGITLVGAVSAAVGGAGATESIEPYLIAHFGLSENTAETIAILAVVVPITYLSVVVGELVPKSIALKNPMRITLAGAQTLFVADRVLSPAVTALEWSTKQIMRVFFARSRKTTPPSEMGLEIDALAPHHQEAILNLAHIERRKLEAMLVPWKDVQAISLSESVAGVVAIIFASGHTRLPVLDGGEIKGVLHTKEFLALRESGLTDWKMIIRPVLKASVSTSVLATLRLMQEKRSHMAVVIGPDGHHLGIVTFEDISEEIWGDIFDEDDDNRIRKILADKVKLKLPPPGFL